ncbi:NAD(P)/FAD-dependent oxidoreductase [Nocardioides korecus]
MAGGAGRTHDVVVVGAGLAGLACARTLGRLRPDLDVVLLEAGDAVGGRVRTDHVDGFTLDRGFQVLNTGYPELGLAEDPVDLDALDLRRFDPAVGLRVGGRRYTLGNPLQRPSTVLGALRLPLGGVRGKAALAAYAVSCLGLPASRLRRRDDVSSARAWERAHVPDDVARRVLRTFFAGVLLEDEMSTSRRFTDLMVKMFVVGDSTVPARGMQALPEQLAARLAPGVLSLGTPVHGLTASSVTTDDGATTARAVVVATDAWDGAGLLPGLRTPPARGVTTVYHAAPEWDGASSMLLMDADDSPVANSIAISRAAPEYAPPGTVLVSTSLVHPVGVDPDGTQVRSVLSRLHGTDARAWEHVATYDLPHALPGMPAPHPFRRPARVDTGSGEVWVAGDHRDTSSIQGALVSGRRVAEDVAATLA